jgi:hypothetical protein
MRLKGRRAIPARQSQAASCYTTASSAAALGHLGAEHKRGSDAKTARRHVSPTRVFAPVFSTGSVFYKTEPRFDRLRNLNLKINYLIGFFVMSGL